jgi:hypothetical protein
MAGCAEPIVKRRSQLGYVGLNNGCPVVWSSKVTSVQFSELNGPAGYTWGRPVVAHPRIAENHADVSSAAAEIYAAGTAVMDFLGLSYVASEAGVEFPAVITLQVDNAACQAFASSRRFYGRSRLRHVDARQHWVQCLRDSELVRTVHVPTGENLADFFAQAAFGLGFVSVNERADDALQAKACGGFLRLVCVSCILLSPNPLRL